MIYKLVESPYAGVFEYLVNNWLKDGWKLQGGASTLVGKYNDHKYVQAMYKDQN